MNKQNKGLVPELRFPEFLNNSCWETVYGNKAFEQISNKDHNSDLPILAITQEFGAIPRGMIDYNVSVTEKSVQSYKVVDVGDFIISLRSFQGGIEYSEYKGLCSPAYVILRNKKGIDKRFFKQYFKSKSFIRDLTKNLEGLRDGKMISYKQFSEVLLPKPSTEEQQKIADCLASIDELIALHTQKLEALKDYKNGFMQQVFPTEGETMPKLRFPSFRAKGAWKIYPLGSVGENLDSKRVPITEKDRVKGNVPYYGASGVIDYVNDYIFDEQLLCISEDGANLRARTYPIAFSISGKTWVNNHAHVIRFKHKSTQTLVENYLNSVSLEDYLTGMAQPKLNRAKLDIISIPLPSPEEQDVIADLLNSLNELVIHQASTIENLEKHKNGLVQMLFPCMDEMN